MKIITNSANKKYFENLKIEDSSLAENYFGLKNSIHMIRPYRIHFNDNIPKDQATGRWLRTRVMPDNKFIEMVDMENPPNWAIYFGLVEEEREVLFF